MQPEQIQETIFVELVANLDLELKQVGIAVTEGIETTALADWPRTRLRATFRPTTPLGTPCHGRRGGGAGRSSGSDGGGGGSKTDDIDQQSSRARTVVIEREVPGLRQRYAMTPDAFRNEWDVLGLKTQRASRARVSRVLVPIPSFPSGKNTRKGPSDEAPLAAAVARHCC